MKFRDINVNFCNYILGSPFKYVGNTITYYKVMILNPFIIILNILVYTKMSIQPHKSYPLLVFRACAFEDISRWTIEGPFTGDYVAGMITAIKLILHDNNDLVDSYTTATYDGTDILIDDGWDTFEDSILSNYVKPYDVHNSLETYARSYAGKFIMRYNEFAFIFDTVDFIHGLNNIDNEWEWEIVRYDPDNNIFIKL